MPPNIGEGWKNTSIMRPCIGYIKRYSNEKYNIAKIVRNS